MPKSSQWSGIARVIDQAPWKTPEQLVGEPPAAPLHERAHGQTLPVFMGAAPVEGVVFWRDGPRIETTTETQNQFDWGPKAIFTGWGSALYTNTAITTTTTVVRMSFAVAHSFNQFQRPGKPLKVELDDVVIFDAIEGTAPPTGVTMRIYDGIDNGFDPAMVAKDGAALTPAYHGLRYLFFDDVDLAQFGGAIPASIRILWGDTTTAGLENFSIPLIPGEAFTRFPELFCYDKTLNEFTLINENADFTVAQLGTTNFGGLVETNLVNISGSPVSEILGSYNATPVTGTGLILTNGANDAFGTGERDLLIETGTGIVRASLDDGDERNVDWVFTQPLPVGSGSHHIAVGLVVNTDVSFTAALAVMLVDATNYALSTIEFGTNAIDSPFGIIATPGVSDRNGATFYVAEPKSGGSLYAATVEDTAGGVSYSAFYTIPSGSITGLTFDAGTGSAVISATVGADTVVRRIDPSDGSVVWSVTIAADYKVLNEGGAAHDGFLGIVRPLFRLSPGYALAYKAASSPLLLIDLARGSTSEIDVSTLGFDTAPDFFDQVTGIGWILDDANMQWLGLGSARLTPGTVTLADELTTFSKYDDDRGGLLTAAQVSTVGLAGIVNGGVIIDADTDLRELSGRLAELYGVLKVETATGVKWVKKATDGAYAADVVLTESDLVEERSGDAVVTIATRDRNPKEIPAEVEVRYISSDAGYEPLPARAAWPQGVFDTALSLLKRSLSVPVVLTDQQALDLAWGVLARERAANRTHALKLRPHRLKVEPSDVFELTAGGQTITGMFTRQTKLPNHALDMAADGYLSRAATAVTAESPIVHAQPTPSFATKHVFLDGPLLRFGHDDGGASLVGYSVLSGLAGWQGGALYRRRSGETTWTKVGEFAGGKPVVGVLTAALPASPWPFETDAENDLTFRVVYGDAAEIAAQTETQFYKAASFLAVGAPGRWTFVTWRNRTANADGTITLDTLRQGLRGSEVHEGTSQAGDAVVLVKAAQALKIDYDLADLDASVELKAVAFGADPNVAIASSFTVSGAAETPRAPGDLEAAISGSDIALSAARRSRLFVATAGGSSGALGSDLDLYRFTIYDGPGGAVLRQYSDVAGASKTYPSADIVADFGAIPDTLTFGVEQKSSIAGIGYGHEAVRSVALQ